MSQINLFGEDNCEFLFDDKTLDSNLEIIVNNNSQASLRFLALSEYQFKSLQLKITLLENASLNLYGGVFTKDLDCNLNFKLVEKGAQINTNIAVFGKNKNKSSLTINTFHQAPQTTSNISSIAIANGNSKISLFHDITIDKGAVKTNSREDIKGVNLSETSTITAIPSLIINENDLFAKHSTSIGSLDSDKIYYLMSRGLNQKEATDLLVVGIVKQISDFFDNGGTNLFLKNREEAFCD